MTVESFGVKFKNVLIEDARLLALGGIITATVILPVQAVSLRVFQIAGLLGNEIPYQTAVRRSLYDGFRMSLAQANRQGFGFFDEHRLIKARCFWGELARQMNVIHADVPDEYTNPFLLKTSWTTSNFWQVLMRDLFYRCIVQDLVLKQMVKRLVKAIAPGRERIVNSSLAKATRVLLTTLFVCYQLPNEYFTDVKRRIHLAATIIMQLGMGMVKESSLGLQGAAGARLMHQIAISSMIWTDC